MFDQALYERAMEAYDAGELKAARHCFEQLVESGVSFPDVLNKLATIYINEGDLRKAATHLKKAFETNPGYTEAAINYMHVLGELGEYDEAMRVQGTIREKAVSVGETRKVDPFILGKIANLHAQVGEGYVAANMIPEAIEEFRRAVKLRPTFADLRTRLAVLLRDSGHVDEAIEHLTQSILDNPHNMTAYLQLGLTYHSMGEADLARKYWETVVEKSPGNKTAHAYLKMLDVKK